MCIRDRNWYHPDEHAIPGNGCIGGLQRLYPGIRITSKTGLAATKAWKMHIACKAKILFGRSCKKWDLQSAEHTPCEFKKFRDGVIFFAYKFSVPLKGLTSKEKGRAPRRKRRSVLSKFKKIAWRHLGFARVWHLYCFIVTFHMHTRTVSLVCFAAVCQKKARQKLTQ